MKIKGLKTKILHYMGFTAMFLIVFIFHNQTVVGQRQREEPPPFKERVFYGGSLSLQLGTYSMVEVLPVVGLWVLPRIAVAVGPGFRYYQATGVKTDIWSLRTFGQLVILRDIDKFIPLGIHTSIFLQVEDEAMSLDSEDWHNVTYDPKRFFINSVLGGAGLSQQIGKRSSMNLMFLWELNNTGYQIYTNPVIRIGFVF